MIIGSSNSGSGDPAPGSAEGGLAATPAPGGAEPPAVGRVVAIMAFAVAGGLLLSACGRKETKSEAAVAAAAAANPEKAPVSQAAAPVNLAAPAAEQEKQRLAQALAMREGKAPPPPAITLRGGELATPEVLDAYNKQLAQLIFKYRDAPESLDELVKRWPMPRLPTPPPGKRVVYDPRYRIIALYPP